MHRFLRAAGVPAIAFWALAGWLLFTARPAVAATFTGGNQPGQGTLFALPVPANATNLSLRVTNTAAVFSHLYLRAGDTAGTNNFDFVARLSPGVAALNLELPELTAGTNYALWVYTPTNSAAHAFVVACDFDRTDARRASMPVTKPMALDVSGVLNPGETNYFQFDVPPGLPGWRLVLTGTGSADPDLLLQRGALPGAQNLKTSSNRRIDTIFLPGTDLTNGTYYLGVTVPATDAGNAAYSLKAELQPLVVLEWDSGLGPDPTEVVHNPSRLGGDYLYKIITTNTLSGLWRTRLTVETGDADLFLRQGSYPTETAKDFASTRAGSDGVALVQPGQFSSGQTWYVMVLAQPGAEWSLFSGNGYVPALPAPGLDGRTGTNTTLSIEGINFYRATVPAGTLAWRLSVGAATNLVLLNRDRIGHPQANPRPDWSLPGQLLAVPPYLKAGSEYYVSVAGLPGESVALDVRPQPVADLPFDGSATVRSTNENYVTCRFPLPADQLAWELTLAATEGDPHLAVRDAFVGNEFVNTAYLEVTNRATHVVTLVPPILHDGSYYVTVYGAAPFTATLSNRRPPVSYVPYRFEAGNPLPTEPGWRYYGVTNIEDQAASLGWELLLNNQQPGSELALRRNRAPGSWQWRSNLVQSTVTTPVTRTDSDYLSTNGYLQRPQHQADIWYIGVRHPQQAAGPFVLTGRDIPVTGLDLPGDWVRQTLAVQPAGYVQYFRVVVPPEALGWEARLTDLLGGLPRVAVGRDSLPVAARSQLVGGAAWSSPMTATNWPSGAQLYFDADWTGYGTSASGTNETGAYFHAGRGNPMVPGTYYLGVFSGAAAGSTARMNAQLQVRGLFPGTSISNLAFAGGQSTTAELRAHEVAWYGVEVPADQPSWKMRVQMPVGHEGLLVLRQTGVPNYAAAVNSPTNVPGVRVRKAGDEHFLLLPTFPSRTIPAGAYQLGLVSEGRGPSGSKAGSNACVFTVTSEGPLVLTNLNTLDPLGGAPLTATAVQAGGEVRGFRFTVIEGTPALEIRLKNRIGNPRMAMRSDGALPTLGDTYGFSGGGTATWADDDYIRIPTPAPGEYHLLVQAAASSGAYPDATYLLEITAQGAEPVAFDGGLVTVTDSPALGWQYFRVSVPANVLGWDLRLTNILKGDPRLVICRDAIPTSLTTRTSAGASWTPYQSTVWPSGSQVAPDKDWTGYAQNWRGINQSGQVFMVPMGNPLEPGDYLIGVTGGGTPTSADLLSYQLLSRGIGDGLAIPVQPVAFAGGTGTTDSAPPREAAYFKVTIPDATPSWRLRMEAQWGDSLLVARRGGLPNFGASVSTAITNLAGTLLQRSNNEYFVLLPAPSATNIPAGDYYLGLVAEGVLPGSGKSGSGTSTAQLRSLGNVEPMDLGAVDAAGQQEIRVTQSLDGGELATYKFAVVPGTVAVVVRLDQRVGNPIMTLRGGTAVPRSSETYGRQGGWTEDFKDPAYLRLPNSAVGEFQLVVQAGAVASRYEPASYTLRIYSLVLGTIPLAFDGGTKRITGHTSKEWIYFSVDVPPEALGWDLRLSQVSGGDSTMVICREDYPRSTLSTFTWATATNWPTSGQAQPGTDWTGYHLNPDGTKADGKVFAAGMGCPLGPGHYIIGVTSASTTDTTDLNYTITSRGIGDGYLIPVLPLAAGDTSLTRAALAPREAAYYAVDVPDESPGWKLALRASRGESLLVARRGGLPNVGASTLVLASAQAGGHKFQKSGDEHVQFGPLTTTDYVPAGRYYLAVVGEGEGPNSTNSTVGAGSSDFQLESRLPGPPIDLGFVLPGGADRLDSGNLGPGETATYRFTLPTGSLGLEVTLDAPDGYPKLRMRNDGMLPLEPTTYGQDGGFKGLWEGTRRLALVSPTSGVYHLTVQAGPTNTIFAPLAYQLRVHAESRVSVLSFDGGRAPVTNQSPDLWKTWLVEVPPQAVGWEVRITDVQGGNPRLVIRRNEVPIDAISRDELYGMTNWPSGQQIAPALDWTGRDEVDGTSAAGRVFQVGMGNPLVPGTYYVGVTNIGSQTATYTVTSRGIGDGFSVPVHDLAFENGTDSPELTPRGVAWYRVEVPTNAVSWKVRLNAQVGESLLVAQQGMLPNVHALPTNSIHRPQGGRLMRKLGNEHLLALAPGGSNLFLAGGTYYLGAIGEGMVASNNLARLGTNTSTLTLTSEGGPEAADLGMLGGSELVAPLSLNGGESRSWQFGVADGTRAVEVWLPNTSGAPALTMAAGASAPGVTNGYGVDAGAPYGWQSGSVITLANPTSTNFAVTVQAGSQAGLFPDVQGELHARAVPITDLAFDALLEGNGLSHLASGTIDEGHRVYFRVQVPALLNGEPVLGWRLSLSSTHGKPLLRVRRGALPDDLPGSETSKPVQRQAVIVPDFLEPGEWYVEVQSGGLSVYSLASDALRLDRPLWVMPGPGQPVTTPGLASDGLVFGDSGVGADGVALPGLYVDLEQDSFHYYAVQVPENNEGLLRTELIAYNGDPNLYVRRAAPPSVAGWTVYDRALTNSVGTEYGHWVPLDRKAETRLAPGRWYLAVHAAGGANVRYRLQASRAQIVDLPFTAGALSEQHVLAAGDWRYFRVALPLDVTDGWEFTLNAIAGAATVHVRDTVPPGHGTNGVDYVTWKNDSPNHGPYPVSYGSGTQRLTVPPLRPGSTYYLGVRALTDARFTLGSSPSGPAIALTGLLPFANGEVTGSMPAGSIRRYRVDAPADGRWFRLTGVHPSSVRLYLDQGSLPTVTPADHWVSSGANASLQRALYGNDWPWVPGQHFYLTVTNTSASTQSFGVRLDGLDCSNDDYDLDGLPDCWESAWFNSIYTYGPASDPDLDGWTNLEEYQRGTNPLVPDPPASTVVGRYVFYNQSVYDKSNAAANADDDAAIAPDKAALRPGTKATFANYTSYQRGLNGIMVDVASLGGTPGAADFELRFGTTGDPATWPIAPAPAAVTVRKSAGVGGSDRITLVWGSDAVKKAWLRVVVRATTATSLRQPDVFYFGNAPGEVGNSTADARVNSTDALKVMGNLTIAADLANRYDMNRDGKVASGDRLVVLNNLSGLDPLTLLDLTAAPSLASLADGGRDGDGSLRVAVDLAEGGLRARWISDGAPVRISVADSPTGPWEPYQRLVGGHPVGESIEVVLPLDANGAPRFYRFEGEAEGSAANP